MDSMTIDTATPDSGSPDTAAPDTGGDTGSSTDAVVDATPDADACAGGCPTGSSCVDGRCTYGAQSCPAGEVAVGFDAGGTITCSSLDAVTRSAVNDNCSVYFGWSDACDDCTTTPVKFGFAGPAECRSSGTDGTCALYTLDGTSLRMYGLNTDGTVNGDDKFNVGFHCDDVTPTTSTGTGMCPAGQFLVGLEADGSLDCTTADSAILDYAGDECSTYLGWRDSCDGCTTDPIKSGRANDSTCRVFTGADCDCTTHTLDGTPVRMFGLNTDGNVDGNDMIHASLACDDVASSTSSADSCGVGELATGVTAAGDVECAEVRGEIDGYMRSSCHLYFGWRDACDGCASPPVKWGRANATSCTDGAGGDNVCGTYTLGGETTDLFGLNLDGSVDGNDQFYVGFTCL